MWQYSPLPEGVSRGMKVPSGRGGGSWNRAETRRASRADKGTQEAMAEQDTRKAMAEQGAQKATAEQGAREAKAEQGAQMAMADLEPNYPHHPQNTWGSLRA